MKTPPAYCATCGKWLTRPHRTGRKPRYCFRSGACRQKAYRRRVKAKRSAKLLRDRLVHLRQESFEWYTPQKYLRAARAVLGGIEIDPASSKYETTKTSLPLCESTQSREKARLENVVLVPASLLPRKGKYQRITNNLPKGGILICQTDKKQRISRILARVARYFAMH